MSTLEEPEVAVFRPVASIGVGGHHRLRRRLRRAALHVFLTFVALVFLFPLVYAIYTALRPYGDIVASPTGFFSLPGPNGLNLDNFSFVWDSANFPWPYLNTLLVTVPAVLLTLWLASMVAFAVSRFSWRFNLLILLIFTAGNLLPPQVIIVPLYRIYNAIPMLPPLSDTGHLYDTYFGLILVHVAFQTGFCVFVLSNYMKTLGKELGEAALVDGAGVFTMYWKIILPLCRPALAALAALEFTWIYNDYFWAIMLIKTDTRRPITAALDNLNGMFVTDPTHLAAGAMLAAIPTVLVYLALQRQFIRGLTLGSTKG